MFEIPFSNFISLTKNYFFELGYFPTITIPQCTGTWNCAYEKYDDPGREMRISYSMAPGSQDVWYRADVMVPGTLEEAMLIFNEQDLFNQWQKDCLSACKTGTDYFSQPGHCMTSLTAIPFPGLRVELMFHVVREIKRRMNFEIEYANFGIEFGAKF